MEEPIPSELALYPFRVPTVLLNEVHIQVPSSSSEVIPEETPEILSKISLTISAEITSPGFRSISSSAHVIAKELMEKRIINNDKYFMKSPN